MLFLYCYGIIMLQSDITEIYSGATKRNIVAEYCLSMQVPPAHRGGVAQPGERLNGIQEVRGSIPLISTRTGLLF